jgi:hypothetical protein
MSLLNSDPIYLIKTFNNLSIDFFDFIISVSKNLQNCDPKLVTEFNHYKILYQTALKADAKLPIEHFCAEIIVTRPDQEIAYKQYIYNGDDDYFLGINVKDNVQINVSDEYALINPGKLKKIWVLVSDNIKQEIKNKLINLTFVADQYYTTFLISACNSMEQSIERTNAI